MTELSNIGTIIIYLIKIKSIIDPPFSKAIQIDTKKINKSKYTKQLISIYLKDNEALKSFLKPQEKFKTKTNNTKYSDYIIDRNAHKKKFKIYFPILP